MTKKKTTYQQFSRKKIYEIAKAYSSGTYTHKNFERQYHKNPHSFYTILHLAVDKCIVDDNIAFKIAKVAANSSYSKVLENTSNYISANQAHSKVFFSWQTRIEKRQSFQFSKREALHIATQYAISLLCKEEFCRVNYISKVLFDRTLKRAIILGWISDDTVQKLFEKSKQAHGEETATALFNMLKAKRSKNVKKKQ